MEDLVEEATDEGGSDVKLGEEQRQTGVARLPQPHSLLVLFINAVAAEHAFEQLGRGGEEKSAVLRISFFTFKANGYKVRKRFMANQFHIRPAAV